MSQEIAKEVFSFDLERVIDRTEQPHDLGLFDIDFRNQQANNPQAREWTYGGTEKTLTKAKRQAERIKRELTKQGHNGTETRIVKSDTGEVINE